MPELTIESLKTLYPEIDSAIRTEAHAAGLVAGQQEGGAKATAAERERITGILVVALGDDVGPKAKALIESGITAEQYRSTGATLIVSAADAEARMKEQILAELKKGGAPSIGADGTPIVPAGSKDFNALVAEWEAVNKCSHADAIRAVVRLNPEAHDAYVEKLRTRTGGKKED